MVNPIFRIGPVEKVNTITADEHGSPTITGLPNGGWIVTWYSYDLGGSKNGIFQQRYSADGQPVGAEQQINSLVTGYHSYAPSVTVLADGGWIVTWESYSGGPGATDIYQQRYDSRGNPLFLDDNGNPADRIVNAVQVSHQKIPSVTALADGGWIVTWQSEDGAGSDFNIYQQRYSSNGQPLYKDEDGIPVDRLVNTTTADHQREPQITALADGGWIVTWEGKDDSATGIYQQRYNAAGSLVGGEQRVNAKTDSSQYQASVMALADGGWVVTWTSHDQTPSGLQFNIYQQRYNKDGQPLFVDGTGAAADRLVNVTTHESPNNSSVTALPDGGWVVTWDSGDTEDYWSGIFMQRYDKNGVAQYATDQLVAASKGSNYSSPAVTSLADGSWVITWMLEGPGGNGIGIYQRAYELNSAPHQLVLDGQTIQENAADGTWVGTLQAFDRNAGDSFSYTLLDDAGGRFALMEGKVVVKDGSRLDYEATSSHQIKVRATDLAGSVHDAVFTISLTDGLDILRGGKGKDVLTGTAGNDRFYGGLGNDTLIGKTGQDVFVFNTKPGKKNVDTIKDFSVKYDTIWLDNAIFKKLGKKGSEANPAKLNKKFLKIGTEAKDKNDYLIYNKKKGLLYYDQDGSGAKAAVVIAKLSKNLKLTAADFFIV